MKVSTKKSNEGEELHGYFISKKQFENFRVVNVEDKELYFLPCRWKRLSTFNKEQVESLLLKYDDKKKIIKELGCTLLQLNNYLNRTYGSMQVEVVVKNFLTE